MGCCGKGSSPKQLKARLNLLAKKSPLKAPSLNKKKTESYRQYSPKEAARKRLESNPLARFIKKITS